MRSTRFPEVAWPPAHTAVGVAAAGAADREPGSHYREEQSLAAAMTPLRRAQFLAGRRAAHRALSAGGLADGPVGSGARGEPRFPEGTVGSITHADGIALALVADAARNRALGVDLQLRALPATAARLVLDDRERAWVRSAPTGTHRALRLLAAFSAKESVFKAVDPLVAGGAPALRRIELRPVATGFLARYARNLPAITVAVRRAGAGVLTWTALAAVSVSRGA